MDKCKRPGFSRTKTNIDFLMQTFNSAIICQRIIKQNVCTWLQMLLMYTVFFIYILYFMHGQYQCYITHKNGIVIRF